MHVNPKPKPPLPGGEHTFMTDTGRQAVRPGIPVVNLIPVGDGGPGPLLPRMRSPKKRKSKPPKPAPPPQTPAANPTLNQAWFELYHRLNLNPRAWDIG